MYLQQQHNIVYIRFQQIDGLPESGQIIPQRLAQEIQESVKEVIRVDLELSGWRGVYRSE